MKIKKLSSGIFFTIFYNIFDKLQNYVSQFYNNMSRHNTNHGLDTFHNYSWLIIKIEVIHTQTLQVLQD